SDATISVLADGETTLLVESESVRTDKSSRRCRRAGVSARFPERRYLAIRSPFHDGIVGNVTEQNISFLHPDGSFNKPESPGQLFNLAAGGEELLESGIDLDHIARGHRRGLSWRI